MDFDQLQFKQNFINIVLSHLCSRVNDQTPIKMLPSPPWRQMLAVVFLLHPQDTQVHLLILNYCNTLSFALTTCFALLVPVQNITAKIAFTGFCIPFFFSFFLLYTVKYKPLVFLRAAFGLPKLTSLGILPAPLSLAGLKHQPSLPPFQSGIFVLPCFINIWRIISLFPLKSSLTCHQACTNDFKKPILS